ncbi:MAG: hypothetical protein J1F32_01870 [Erysipelotrichales bacterium]|nr:hypothetical protein [Erysipelotrichales bacterium]
MAKVEKEEKKCLKVERETYDSKSKEERYTYFVKGVLRGKEMKASLIPSDIGGYELLDMLFIGTESVDLIVDPFEIVNKDTGEVMKGNSYIARVIENDEKFECPVKPRQKSDKAILDMLLSRL